MELDEIDRKILYLLQKEDRTDLTHDEIASRIDVSSSTVSNRLKALRHNDILVDYSPIINYENAGIPHHMLFVCTAPISARKELAERTIDIQRVIDVRELLTGKRNLHVEVVCLDTTTIETVTDELDEIGLEIESSEILRRNYNQPYSDFDTDVPTDGADS